MAFCNSNQRQYLALCAIPARASRDGYSGINAHLYLPFVDHIYFFSGAVEAFPGGRVAQNKARFVAGNDIPTSFSKGFDCCPCA
jgi:hypothetical protein